MDRYQRILLATDFAPESTAIAERAAELAQHYGAELALLHVVEYIALEYPADIAIPETFELEATLVARAREQLAALAQGLGLPETGQRVEVGATKTEIIRVAREWGADLIVLGSHGRHGLALLLGSTANAVLHSAPCDVLAVRVRG